MTFNPQSNGLHWCIQNGEDAPKQNRDAQCLFTLALQDGSLKVLETRGDLDVYTLSIDAKNILETVRSKSA